MSLPARASGFLQRSQDGRSSDSVAPGANGLVDNDEGGAVDCCAGIRWGQTRMTPTAMSAPNVVRPCAMMLAGKHTSCQSGLVDNLKSRMLEWRSLSRFVRVARDLREMRDGSDVSSSRVAPVAYGLLVSLTIHGGFYGYDGTCGAG